MFFFPVDNKLHSRDDVSRHCEGFQRATTSFPPPETNPALVVKTCFSSVPSGMSPAASAPWYLDGAIAAVFHLNVWKRGRRMQGEWLCMRTEVEKNWNEQQSERPEVNNVIMTPSALAMWSGSKAYVQMVVMVAAVVFRQGNYGEQT